MSEFEVRGPKGGVVIRRARLARVRQLLPDLVHRFGRVTVAEVPADVRVRAADVMRLLLDNEQKVHYAQVRPMRTRSIRNVQALRKALASQAGVKMDCSESATLICRLAGVPDPNGLGYDGTGYTGTLLSHLPQVRRASQLDVGDLVVFGPGAGTHVCTVLEPGADPLLFSHGQERGPITIRLSAETRYQAPPTRHLKIGA